MSTDIYYLLKRYFGYTEFRLKQEDIILSGIGFNMADKYSLLENSKPVDIVFAIDENEWQGNTSLQLKIIDLLPASSAQND